jgi:hypothetical protein
MPARYGGLDYPLLDKLTYKECQKYAWASFIDLYDKLITEINKDAKFLNIGTSVCVSIIALSPFGLAYGYYKKNDIVAGLSASFGGGGVFEMWLLGNTTWNTYWSLVEIKEEVEKQYLEIKTPTPPPPIVEAETYARPLG